MYAMGLLGLLLAGLIALGAALGLFTGPDDASAARLTAEGYVLTRAASFGAVRDAASRSQNSMLAGLPVLTDAASESGGICLAPWTATDICTIRLTPDEMEPFAPPGWLAPTRSDGSPRWLIRLEADVVYVYGPANAEEMAAIRKSLRYPAGLAWCPPGGADGAACTPALRRLRPDGTPEALPLPPEVQAPGDASFAVSAMELNL